ncbi:MAG: hypothetical protein EDM05_000460 (plasmid) [Leptolyngbya sp. IPPAS B-1204]
MEYARVGMVLGLSGLFIADAGVGLASVLYFQRRGWFETSLVSKIGGYKAKPRALGVCPHPAGSKQQQARVEKESCA